MRAHLTVVLACLLPAATTAWAEAPGLESPLLLESGGVPLDAGTYATPTVVDWNNDGRRDLLIGQHESEGKIRLYLNSGTDAAPAFSGWSYLQSMGTDIITPGGT